MEKTRKLRDLELKLAEDIKKDLFRSPEDNTFISRAIRFMEENFTEDEKDDPIIKELD